MTPWLRLILRFVRLLLVLATAVPVYGAAPAYGAQAAPPDPPAPSARPTRSASPGARAPASAAAPVPVVGAASRSASPAEPSRAGSRAGEGRMRPGRPDGPASEEEGDDDTGPVTGDPRETAPEDAYPEEPETADSPAGTPAATGSPQEAGLNPARPPLRPTSRGDVHQGEASDETLRILPLGSGLVLIGLGLGLAFLGLRVRRS
ncbi:hypothetical protein J2Z21_003787 [Streptomyces griseochromogenes]|uniref:Gram-positive cocci surface proteins LPxTG domain-containing protein n=1 Tax=Streptomyces griseochromogenes TaxID=68214 RepID=A0A1B1ANT4_9ACTN|nr:hypothetical protein [Streptomyces griseochromogenes]ANP48238.1 hypothetical protein AVL59_00430 [Streptomyces griseochromogenes]MBP2050837.1 hypothetical protein [Streptomyces griseochromogenes]